MANQFVSVAELRQRVAGAIGALEGFREVPWPASPMAAPAGFDVHPFAVIVPDTLNTGRYRDNAASGIRAKSNVTIQFLSAIIPSEDDQHDSFALAVEAEARVIQVMEARGAAWTFGMHPILYLSSSRGITEDGGFLVVDVVFAIDHVVRLA